MERCRTCKHWVQVDPTEYGVLIGSGDCTKVPQIWDVSEEIHKRGRWRLVLKPEHASVLAVVDDADEFHAKLFTMPDFGCVQHEPDTRAEYKR